MRKKQDKPFFSVIIPTFNRADLIETTLNTVFNQSFKDYEIIVVDNCSTDNTKEILTPLVKQQKIVFIQHDKNYERAKSRNTGMRHARGEYVTFLDSDDLMYEHNLSDAYQFSTVNPTIKLFHNLYELVDSRHEPIYQYEFPKLRNVVRQISIGNFLSCIGVFLQKDIYEAFSFNEDASITGSEDWDFWLRIIGRHPQIGRINKINNGILHHSGRTVNNQAINQVIERKLKIIEQLKNDNHYSRVYKPYFKVMEANVYIYAAITANANRLYYSAKKLLYKALQIDFGQSVKIRFFKALSHAIVKK